jgi:hypothetical protein
MNTMYSSNTNQVITRNRLQSLAPSVFANEHKAGLSSKYVFVPTSEIVDEMEREGWLPVRVQEMRVRNAENQGFQKHLIRFRNFCEGIKEKLEVGDTMIEIVLTNSHNGTSAFIFNCGMYRCVCSNQMMVSERAFDAIHVRHSGYDASQLLNVTGEVVRKAPAMIDKVQEFKGIELTTEERNIFGQAAKQLRFAKPDIVETERVLKPNRPADTGNDLWKTFNTVQENLIKGHVSYIDRDEAGRPQRKTTKEVKAIDSNMKLNQALFTLTEKMAELKRGIVQ